MEKKRSRRKRKPAKMKIGGQPSENHRLHHEEKNVRKELHSVNKELVKGKKKPMFSMIWVVMLLLYGSLMLTSYGAYIITTSPENVTSIMEHIEEIIVANETISETTAQKIPDIPDSKKYHGVLLESIVPVSYEYLAGENAIIETIIDLRDISTLDIKAEYELYDGDGNKVYVFGDTVQISDNNEVLRKSILLTENYVEGEYTLKFKGWFEKEGTRYVLPGVTKFIVVEKPREAFTAALGKPKLLSINTALLLLILLLNAQLLYTAWKARDE